MPPNTARGGQTPAAALTGWGTGAHEIRVLRAGFQDHVAKPVDARRLVAIVTTLAAKSHAGLAAEANRRAVALDHGPVARPHGGG